MSTWLGVPFKLKFSKKWVTEAEGGQAVTDLEWVCSWPLIYCTPPPSPGTSAGSSWCVWGHPRQWPSPLQGTRGQCRQWTLLPYRMVKLVTLLHTQTMWQSWSCLQALRRITQWCFIKAKHARGSNKHVFIWTRWNSVHIFSIHVHLTQRQTDRQTDSYLTRMSWTYVNLPDWSWCASLAKIKFRCDTLLYI